jgi:hypothetical protein
MRRRERESAEITRVEITAAGADVANLDRENPRARRFYARHGFEEVAPYHFMVGDQADEDILCRARL